MVFWGEEVKIIDFAAFRFRLLTFSECLGRGKMCSTFTVWEVCESLLVRNAAALVEGMRYSKALDESMIGAGGTDTLGRESTPTRAYSPSIIYFR